ncbi:MAG: ABC transporter permease [Marinibacterium sp.]|nr:ABC transporter permease [Marinibacterium sp.]
MTETLTFLLSGTLLAGTPLLIAALGELVTEKSGILNLSVEGMMAVGAIFAFMVVTGGGSYWVALAAGGMAALVVAALFAVVVIFTLANQVAAGLAVGILGLGLAGLIGDPFEAQTVPPMPKLPIPGLAGLPVLGRGLFDHVPVVYLAPVLALATWLMLTRTRLGLLLRSAGENPDAANSIGINVRFVRFCATLYGGFCAGVAGGFISVVSATLWADGIIAGRGWIVVALVVFGTWRAGRIAIGAYLFGLATLSGLLVQTTGVAIPSQLLTSIPYIVTIVAIALLSMNPKLTWLNAPVSLGQPYLPTK